MSAALSNYAVEIRRMAFGYRNWLLEDEHGE